MWTKGDAVGQRKLEIGGESMTVEQLTEKISDKSFGRTRISKEDAPFVARIIKMIADEHLTMIYAIQVLDDVKEIMPYLSGIRL